MARLVYWLVQNIGRDKTMEFLARVRSVNNFSVQLTNWTIGFPDTNLHR